MRRRGVSRYAAVVCLLLVSGCGAAQPGTRAPAEEPAPEVTGYALDDATNALIDRNAGALTTVGVDGVVLTRGGRAVSAPSAGALRVKRRSQADGLRAELLVSNYSDALGDFSPAYGARLLRHPAYRNRVADRLAVLAVGQGWDGVTVDLESLRRADADGLVLFVRRLRARLPAGTSISVDLMASTSVAGYHAAGYSLRPLAATADVLALMTYDEHGPTWSGPGPVGPLPWQRKALAALLTRVSPSKVDLGVAGYGYSWPTSGTGHDWSVAAIRKKVDDAGGVSQWLPKAGEWTATLPDGTVFWWSDRRSYDLRHDLAVEQHLHGLALWRLGSADPLD